MFAEMNANGMSLPRVPPRDAVLLEQPRRTAASARGARSSPTRRRRRTRSTRTRPGSPGANIAANSAAITQFHANLQNAVTAGFAQQSAKYGGTVPQENPLRYNAHRLGAAAGGRRRRTSRRTRRPSRRRTRRCIRPGRRRRRRSRSTEDEASIFWNLGIPGFSVGGVQDSNIDENPYPLDDQRCDPLDAGPAVHGRRDGVRARAAACPRPA